MWRLHGPDRRNGGAILPSAYWRGRGQVGRYARRAGKARPTSGSPSLDRTSSSTVRLLPDRPNHAGHLASRSDRPADRRGHQRGDVRQSLPMRDLSAHSGGDPRGGCEEDGGEVRWDFTSSRAAHLFSDLLPWPAASLSAPTAMSRRPRQPVITHWPLLSGRTP